MPQAPSIWAMIRCGPGGETAAPAKMAPRSPCPAAPLLPAWSLRSFNGLSLRPPPGMGIGWAFCASRGRLWYMLYCICTVPVPNLLISHRPRVAICVFSTQFSILIIVGLIGPNRGDIPDYIALRLGPRLLCHVNHWFLDGIFDLQKSTGYLWSIEICTWAP